MGDTYITSLDEITRHQQILLVRADLDVMRANDRLRLVGVVEALDVVEIRDVKGSNV